MKGCAPPCGAPQSTDQALCQLKLFNTLDNGAQRLLPLVTETMREVKERVELAWHCAVHHFSADYPLFETSTKLSSVS
jgi:hypothetical protein